MSVERFINKFLIDLKPYSSISQEIWKMNADEWNDVLKLDWNEATIEPTPNVRTSIKQYFDNHNFFRLYPCISNKRLIDAVSHYAEVPEENVQYFSGSDSLHEYICKCYIQSGDKVLILWPSYDNFRASAEANGASIIYSEMNDSFEPSLYGLYSDIAYYNPKIVYICNPNNPTGSYIEKKEIKRLIEKYTDTLFVIDEAYAEFTYQSVNEYVLSFDNILVTHTLSKAFGLANIRFGYLVSSVDHIDILSRIRNPKNITTYSQIAAIAAFDDIEYMWNYVDEVNRAREWFYCSLKEDDLFKSFSIFPSKSNFILIRCPSVEIKAHIYYSLRERSIFVRQLNQTSSLLDCIRITIGTSDQMKRVYNAIVEIVGGVKSASK